jgi:flagellar biosynthesis/type III secretory pathway chaperone
LQNKSAELQYLETISQQLDVLIQLSIPKSNTIPSNVGRTEREVLELCDLRNTVADMMKKLNKKRSHIAKTLTTLRKKNLIASMNIHDQTYYVRLA